jgi:ankyrin repeat protein
MMNKDFFDAIRAGDHAKVAQMIEADSGLLNAPDDNGLRPFTVARYSRQDAIAQLLLDKGAQLDICAAAMAGAEERLVNLLASDRSLATSYSHDGWTPLHLAAFFGHNACAEILLANGADVHARSRNAMDNTPLHAAAAGRHLDVITVLLAHGADVNARQHGGWTALHAAAQNGDVETIRVLLAHGAAELSRADNNQTALDLALTRGHQAVVDLLDAHARGEGA